MAMKFHFSEADWLHSLVLGGRRQAEATTLNARQTNGSPGSYEFQEDLHQSHVLAQIALLLFLGRPYRSILNVSWGELARLREAGIHGATAPYKVFAITDRDHQMLIHPKVPGDYIMILIHIDMMARTYEFMGWKVAKDARAESTELFGRGRDPVPALKQEYLLKHEFPILALTNEQPCTL